MLFNRYVVVRIKNLQTGVVTVIPNDFKIEFDYTKQLDEGKSASTGSVTIYGLSQETVKAFGQLYSTVELSCGYLGEKNVKSLFVAQATEISYKKDGGNSITSISVSNAFATMNMGKKYSKSFTPDADFGSILSGIMLATDAGEIPLPFEFPFDNDAQLKYITEYKFPYGYYLHGSLKEVLDELCYIVGLTWRVKEGAYVVVFGFTESKAQEISNGSGQPISYQGKNVSLVLNADSGLIGNPYIKSDVVSENYGAGHDSATSAVVLNRATKYKKDGTVVTKAPKKIRVRRFSVDCKALIDPTIEPNSLIRVESTNDAVSGLFRVRNVKFTGDNFGDSWYMDLELSSGYIV